MTIEETLHTFDTEDKMSFGCYDITIALGSVDDAEKAKSEFLYEQIGWSLSQQHGENPWGVFYYGPQFTFADPDGNSVYYPSFEQITPEAVSYWEKRCYEVVNPLLKVRYAGLVWDFKRSVLRENLDGKLYQTLVDCLLSTINGDYCSHPVETVNLLERLFEITKNKPEDLSKCKRAYKDFEKRHYEDTAVRFWASRFNLMLEYKKLFTQEEKDEIIAEHEARLSRLSTAGDTDTIDPWCIEKQAVLLAEYYTSKSLPEESKRVLGIVESSFHNVKTKMNGLQYAGNLERLLQLYTHFNLESEAKRMLVDVQQASAEASKEMQGHTFEYEIPQEVFTQADDLFGEHVANDDVRWSNFAIYFIPIRAKEEICLKELARRYPFKFMMATKLMDVKGRPMSNVGPLETDPDGHLALHITEKLNLTAHFLSLAINKLLTTGTLTVEKVMNNLIEQSPLFEESRYGIIRRALEFFVQGDYVMFSHLIVPQIENAICNLVEMNGVTVLKPQRNRNGFQLKTLDDLLREKAVSEVFTEDGAYYLRLVLTNQIGLNIRNLMCHGIVPAQHFGYGAAGRLLHVLVMLGTVRAKG